MAKHRFKTEVSQLLDLIIHSLYSHKEIFLRELISNASDALDKLRYLTLTDEDYKGLPFVPRIDLSFRAANDEGAGAGEGASQGAGATLTITDSGIGMSKAELGENLGTIARSGTRRFVDALSKSAADAAAKDTNLIGQFGVGFYASFMVAERVEVTTLRAGETQAYRWVSTGRGQYEIDEAERTAVGTSVVLHLSEAGAEFASRWRIESLVEKYSNHIAYPIYLHYQEQEGDDKPKQEKVEQINSASALWKRPKSELSDEDYHEFYKTLSHDEQEPLHFVHTHAEGTQEYTTLFYIPKQAPPDLYYADYRPGVKLYVKRVFITDDEKELLPTYLRFVRGIIDSEDLPLNVSREILQENRVLATIRNASVKKILSELQSLSNNPELYQQLITEFGRPLKEGLYQDFANRETLLELVRFRTTANDGWTSLAEYVSRMGSEQKAIYYLTGERGANLRRSPLLEAYRKQDIEVLLMDDEIDGFVIPTLGNYQDKELKSVNRSDTADDLKTEENTKQAKEIDQLIARIKQVLGDQVKDVKASSRLSDSPSCIVADESDPTASMQSVLRSLGQDPGSYKPVLEVNPSHAIVQHMNQLLEGNGKAKAKGKGKQTAAPEQADDGKNKTGDEKAASAGAVDPQAVLDDASRLLLEQALLIEGVELPDPVAFAARLNRVMERALA